jgi:hypothetical protein
LRETVTSSEYLARIRDEFNNRVRFAQKRPGLYQLVAPFYHEDGDMYDIFIEDTPADHPVRLTDKGLTLMRLSYSYEIDTPNKERIFHQILREHGVQNDDGELFIVTSHDRTYQTIMRFTRAITAITNMALYRREVVRSLFYEMFAEFVRSGLTQFEPVGPYLPLADRDDLEVNFMIPSRHKPIFLFGSKDDSKAKLIAISCLEFLRNDVSFRSVVVHENFESLTSRDRKIITNVVDKQFTDLDDFQKMGPEYLLREIA